MALFDDQPLARTEPPAGGPPAETPSGRTLWIGAAVVSAVILGGLARWWTLETQPGPPSSSPSNSSAGTEVAIAPPPPALPPLNAMDPFLRVLLGTLSARPELSRWLATDDLIRQMALIIDRLSVGASPAKELKALRPNADFETARQGRGRVINPASYRRYDGLAETVASLDAGAAARVYRTIKPRLAEAYRALGRSTADVDTAVGVAIDTLTSTPKASDPVAVREGKGATWAFADAELEALDPAQKHLLRMGPANAAKVTAKLEQIRAALRTTP